MKTRVLVCDDDELNLEAARELLAEEFDFIAAPDGKACLELAGKFKPDVVLLDIMMPGMDGYEVCRRIQQAAAADKPQVILVTAKAGKAERLEGYRVGADDYVVKPFDHDELLAKTRVHARLRRTMNALAEAQMAAEVASKAKSDFLAAMSHEIRTPMTAILGFAENLLDDDQTAAQRLSWTETIQRNGKHLLTLINDILDMSKIEADKMTVERIACEPCRILAEVASLMRGRAKEKGLKLEIDYDGAIPVTISSDPTRLRQILINMVGNAIKFTKAGSVSIVTRLSTEQNEPRLVFEVIDTGVGMTEQQVAGLFQPFAQAEAATSRQFGGTGLGLAISKRFAGMLGGDIVVSHSEVGVGTTMRISIATGAVEGVEMLEHPMAEGAAPDSHGLHVRTAPLALSGCRVLLVEDAPDNRRLILFFLERAGAAVTVAENGQVAVDKVMAAAHECKPFDVVLMDMQMPVLDGYEATTLLRSRDYAGSIIALTAQAMTGDRKRCIDAGCDDYATKPIQREKLIAMMVEQVRRKSSGLVCDVASSDR